MLAIKRIFIGLTILLLGEQAHAVSYQVGVHFVDSAETIDFIDPFTFGDPPITLTHQIEPWLMTDPTTRFVTEGAFAGQTESMVHEAIFDKLNEKFFTIPTPATLELNLDLRFGEVSGPDAVNIIIGEHTITNSPSTGTWFGVTDPGAGLVTPNGQNLAAVSVERIGTDINTPFDTMDKAVNAVANVIAHEIAHLYDVEHVCADASGQDCVPGDPVVTNPYDVMSTGWTGLPDEGWVADNIFTTVPGTQPGGLSTVDALISNLGLRLIGDTDDDGDIDTADITVALSHFPSLGIEIFRQSGDTDHDGDVDTADITTVLANFTGAQSPVAGAATLSTPEPTTLGLALLGLCGMVARHHRNS